MNSCPLIPADWDLPAVLRIRLGHGPGRQRVLEAEEHLLILLHELPKAHQPERVGRLFWRTPDGDWRSSAPGAGPNGIEEHLSSYKKAIDRLSVEVEDARTSEDCFHLLGRLSPLARSTRNMYATLQEARKLRKDDVPLIDWRDTAYDLSRQVELLQSDAKTALDYEVARQAERQAQASHQMATSAHRLNVLAAFFFPLATLSAVLGANMQHIMPDGLSPRWALADVLGIGLVLGSGLTYLVTLPARRPGKREPTSDGSHASEK